MLVIERIKSATAREGANRKAKYLSDFIVIFERQLMVNAVQVVMFVLKPSSSSCLTEFGMTVADQ